MSETNWRIIQEPVDAIKRRHARIEYPVGRLPELAEEQYVIVHDRSEAWLVHDRVMDPESRKLHQKRMKHLVDNGVVAEQNMPDTFRALQEYVRDASRVVVDEAQAIREACCCGDN